MQGREEIVLPSQFAGVLADSRRHPVGPRVSQCLVVRQHESNTGQQHADEHAGCADDNRLVMIDAQIEIGKRGEAQFPGTADDRDELIFGEHRMIVGVHAGIAVVQQIACLRLVAVENLQVNLRHARTENTLHQRLGTNWRKDPSQQSRSPLLKRNLW